MKNGINKKLLFLITFLLIGMMFVVYVTYAYYNAEVSGNESESTVAVTGGILTINYQNNSGDIVAEKIMPGWSATKSFTVTATVDYNEEYETNFKISYDMLLIVERNDFLTGSLEYLLEPIEEDKSKEGIFVYDKYREVPAGTNLEGVLMGRAWLPDDTVSHTYNLTLRYIDRDDVDQTSEMEGKFYARVNIRGSQKSMIRLDLDGGEIAGDEIYYAFKGEVISLPKPRKYRYVFAGWFITDGDGSVEGSNVIVNGETLDLKALWRVRSVDGVLLIDLDGGTSTQETLINIKTGEEYTLEVPTKEGYLFSRWDVVSGDVSVSGNNIIAIDDEVELIALWESVVPDFTYTGTYTLINDTANNWRIKFLTSGTLEFTRLGNAVSGIDVFLVGGGGGSSGGGGGGGGYTTTAKSVYVNTISSYAITIGGSGGTTKAFEKSANGGKAGGQYNGGAGGSGGGGGSTNTGSGGGGSDGGSGGSTYNDTGTTRFSSGGSGQGTTTREFGESTGDLYAGGGGGKSTHITSNASGGAGGGGRGGSSGSANTGGGAGGYGGSGGSGIVVIRNARD